ncbi:GIY-YIG nuclease family protein [Streptomyces sp. NPDC018036]|uniref:GIY-YIG nuclease family protein n=1 Tax=Streptomyces sp. NPDC018036 TaxID=3365035 RepID=UPI0037A788E3
MTIYVIGAESSDLVKIGYTGGDPRTRLAQLQTGQPQQLYLLWTCGGGRDLERALHSRFAPYRSRGEWFDLTRLGDPRKAIREAVSELAITRVPGEVNKTSAIDSKDDRASQGPDSDDEWEILDCFERWCANCGSEFTVFSEQDLRNLPRDHKRWCPAGGRCRLVEQDPEICVYVWPFQGTVWRCNECAAPIGIPPGTPYLEAIEAHAKYSMHDPSGLSVW